MRGLDRQTEYWDRVAEQKRFTHPIDAERFAALVPTTARILDHGCGYGRTCSELAAMGYRHVIGIDISLAMIGRGRRLHPDLDLRHVPVGTLPFPADSFDAVLLFAVLTCIPADGGQEDLISEIRRVLRPGGILHVSDYPLQDDPRNRQRYERSLPEFGTFGVFRLPEGAVMRHHAEEWFDRLLRPFRKIHARTIDGSTMNDNRCRIFQYLGRT
ncbi:MAG: class I SAM-dependent methyltransferase [Planctomycetes bacterium]|nr:class I SAM-dependent methyltransferase [Planctomycetota bacterium]